MQTGSPDQFKNSAKNKQIKTGGRLAFSIPLPKGS
jgi:hypothetical protein